MKNQEKVVCEICGKEFKSLQSLGLHLKTHKICKKEYYDKYFKKYDYEGICDHCKVKKTKFRRLSYGYYRFCSNKCATQSNKTKKKAKQTYFERTGYEHPSHDPKIKEKIKNTNIKNNGVEYPMQSKNIQDKRKKGWLEKYGVEHPLQNKEIFNKHQMSCFKYKEYKMPSGDIINIQGYEYLALDILVDQYDEKDILTHNSTPTIKYTFKDNNKIYFPDIYIPSENLIIEVKSTWIFDIDLEKNLTKQQACLEQGYKFKFMIFDIDEKIVKL